jgi:hypothetical protein
MGQLPILVMRHFHLYSYTSFERREEIPLLRNKNEKIKFMLSINWFALGEFQYSKLM